MEIFFTKIVSIIIAPVLFFSGLMGIGQDQNLGAVIPTSVALFETSLANSITSSATSMTLVSATTKDGTTLATSTYAFIIDEGTASEEFVTATCVSTACTSMTRGLSVLNGTSTVAALQKAHRRGASVKITDAPQLLILSRILNGQETVPNILQYSSSPTFTTSNSIVDKNYVDATSTLLRNELTTASTTADTHIARTDNPHTVTKTQVGLSAVSNDRQMKAATSTPTDGMIPIWSGSGGDLLADGYSVGVASSSLCQFVTGDKYPQADGSLIQNLSSGFADPMTAIGDLIYRDTTNTTARLPVGATSTVLTSTGTSTVWANPITIYSTTTSATLSVTTLSTDRIVVTARGYCTWGGAGTTAYLKFGGVTKDSYESKSTNNYVSQGGVHLQYSENTIATTTNITLEGCTNAPNIIATIYH